MLSAVLASALLQAPPARPMDALSRVRELAQNRVALARSAAGDADVVKAVAESNARAESVDEIQRKDAIWAAQKQYPLRRIVTGRPCSNKLRKLVSADEAIVEAFAMDDRGALVCATVETSDYWQGDEMKWIRTFRQGRDVFLEEPALDASTGVYAVQVSVPMAAADKRIGAVTLTLKLRRSELTR